MSHGNGDARMLKLAEHRAAFGSDEWTAGRATDPRRPRAEGSAVS